MGVSYSKLYPSKAKFFVGDTLYKLRPFSLKAYVWVEEEYSTEDQTGIEVLIENLHRVDIDTIFNVGFYLVEGFEKNLSDFIKFFSSRTKNETKEKTISKLANAIIKTINDSQLSEEERKLEKQLNDCLGSDDKSGEDNYAVIFDSFSSRHGGNLEQFYNYTPRQIHYIQKAIISNKRLEVELAASLHGRELKAQPNIEVNSINEYDKKVEVAKRGQEILMKRHKEFMDKKNG